MISFSAIRKIKCPLALCVIVSFALVFGCDLLCDLGIISFAPATPTVVAANSHNHNHSHENEQGNHGSSATGHDHNLHNHAGDRHGNEAEDCCDDITQQFYSSLVSSSGGSFGSLIHAEAFKVICTFTLPNILKIESFKRLQVVSTYDHNSNGPPGGKVGQHIIILFCTFLI
ncbi:MAG: hypothetical protein JNM57_06080 [Cyclobacteriaceae bacterium]|jgi:hypothetical protein|nr:hypothetical protein [Cyclobacteriaceae bacterium]